MARIRGLTEVEALLESKRPKTRSTPSSDIGIAVFMGNVERVTEFLDREPSLVNRVIDKPSGTPLVLAAGRGRLEVDELSVRASLCIVQAYSLRLLAALRMQMHVR
jgi:hypothetical protein